MGRDLHTKSTHALSGSTVRDPAVLVEGTHFEGLEPGTWARTEVSIRWSVDESPYLPWIILTGGVTRDIITVL